MRVLLLLLISALNAVPATIATRDNADWAVTGRAYYAKCEFKNAVRSFTKALQSQPKDALLHHWLGKSYARMAEVASPLSASRDARRARLSLERAVELEPRNQEFLRELFGFYLDSPEWFNGGLNRAALLVDKIEPQDPGAQTLLRNLLADARQEYHGPTWRLRQASLLPTGQMGRIVP